MTSSPRAAPPTRSGPQGTTPESRSNAHVPASTSTTVSVPPVTGVCYEPAGRRRRWLAVVEVCPRCKHAHVHYGSRSAPPNGVRTTTCGYSYRVFPVYGGESNPPEVAA